MPIQTIEAEARDTGKKAARAVRRNGNVPCILYGRSVEPVAFQAPSLTVKRLAYGREANRVSITFDGDEWNCILKDVDLDPLTDEPIHADFQVLQAGEAIRLTVPVRFEGIPRGQSEGGDTQFVLNEVEITCLPANIPNHIAVEISELDIGESIHISDLDVEGVEFELPPEQTVITVVAPFVEPTTTAEEEEELLEAEVAEEGEIADTAETEEGEAEAEEGPAVETEEEEE